MRGYAGAAAGGASPSRMRGGGGSRTRRRWSGSASWRSRRPGRRSGSAPTRSATSRRPASTPPGASSTSTTSAGSSAGPSASSRRCASSPPRCRGCAVPSPRDLQLRGDAARAGAGLRRAPARPRLLPGRRRGATPRTNESYGLATIRREHVSVSGGEVVFDFPAKSGQRRVQSIRDPRRDRRRSRRCAAAAAAPTTCSPSARAASGATSAPTTSTPTSRRRSARSFSAKDFRTWHGTVLAAVELAGEPAPELRRRRRSARSRAAVETRRRGARQHARGLPPLLHRPARLRPLTATASRSSRRCGGGDEMTARVRSRVERSVLELVS